MIRRGGGGGTIEERGSDTYARRGGDGVGWGGTVVRVSRHKDTSLIETRPSANLQISPSSLADIVSCQ
ncbi:hypothetical protein ACOSQ2_029777 [Xanthoceras sorbifolium]